MHKDYLQRPDKPNRQHKPKDEDEREDEELEDRVRGNRNKTPLYQKPLRDIKKFPFMANKQTDDGIDEEDEDDERSERPKKADMKDAFDMDMNASGNFDF